jgi:hypothetical protein
MNFDPLDTSGHVWLSKGRLTCALTLAGDAKTSESSVSSEAKTSGWQTQLSNGKTFYLVPCGWVKTRLGLENLTPDDFNSAGELSRMVSRSITIIGDGTAQLTHSTHAADEALSRALASEAETQKLAGELTQADEKIATLKKQVETLKRDADRVPGLEAALTGRDGTIHAMGETLKTVAAQSTLLQVAEQLASLTKKVDGLTLPTPVAVEAEEKPSSIRDEVNRLADSVRGVPKHNKLQFSWRRRG